MSEWTKHKLESRLRGEISVTSDMQMTPPLTAESKEELKSLLMKVKEESEKAGLKLIIQKTKIMASGPITLWQIDGKIMETVTDCIFLGSKITANGDCSRKRNFGKLSSGHRTVKGQFSFQSQRRAMPKNAQTTTRLHSSHTLVK